jgi:hypothetical protein
MRERVLPRKEETMLIVHEEKLNISEIHDLWRYVKDSEIRRLKDIRAYDRERERVKNELERRGMSQRDFFLLIGEKDATARKAFTDTAIRKRQLSWALLKKCLDVLKLEPHQDFKDKLEAMRQ